MLDLKVTDVSIEDISLDFMPVSVGFCRAAEPDTIAYLDLSSFAKRVVSRSATSVDRARRRFFQKPSHSNYHTILRADCLEYLQTFRVALYWFSFTLHFFNVKAFNAPCR